MKKKRPSSFTPEQRFLFNLTKLVAIGVVLLFAIFMGILIQQRIHQSDNVSRQGSSPAEELSNVTNNQSAETAWNVRDDASTNALTPLPAPIIFNTNSN
jgi:hypothetical protein